MLRIFLSFRNPSVYPPISDKKIYKDLGNVQKKEFSVRICFLFLFFFFKKVSCPPELILSSASENTQIKLCSERIAVSAKMIYKKGEEFSGE